jgi:hypothetical protein
MKKHIKRVIAAAAADNDSIWTDFLHICISGNG